MSANQRTQALSDAGVAIWLDDLSRQRVNSGDLAELITTRNVVGVTTNPSIFQAAIAAANDYDEEIAHLAAEGADTDAIVERLTTDVVRDACDVFMDLYRSTDGRDGRVSIEVDPRLAHDTAATIEQARHLHQVVDRENVMIKIPATAAGLPAITATLAAGISVNVTLIFSVQRYQQVLDAYAEGMEQAAAAGHDLASIHSVASFFVSRVDTEIDARLEQIGSDDALAQRGRAALANARAAFGTYLEAASTARFRALQENGAMLQRPLWASTGVKNPQYADTMYVDGLVANPCVNTMPEKTLEAVADHSEPGQCLDKSRAHRAHAQLESIASIGIDLEDVFSQLERDGVQKFEDAWLELLSTVRETMKAGTSPS